jgi:hypothetical protein
MASRPRRTRMGAELPLVLAHPMRGAAPMAERGPLPRADIAVISVEKLRDYILSRTHPVGRFKAAFFERLGYSQDDWQTLAVDLRRQHLPMPAERVDSNTFGSKYRIDALIVGPAGRSAMVVSVWIVLAYEEAPRLVTLYPGGA